MTQGWLSGCLPIVFQGLTKHIPLVLGNVTEPTGAEVSQVVR